jgi:hypothetical protein
VNTSLALRHVVLQFTLAAMAAIGLAGCQASAKNEFESECKKIELNISEQEVDQILAGYPCERRELAEYENEEPISVYTHFKLERKGSFVKTYDCELKGNEGHFFVEVYFDDNHTVVGRAMEDFEFKATLDKVRAEVSDAHMRRDHSERSTRE